MPLAEIGVRPTPAGDFVCFEAADAADDRRASLVHGRLAVAVTATVWLCNYGILTARSIVDGQPEWQTFAVVRVPIMLLGCAFCYLMHLCLQRLGERPFWQRAVALGVLAVIAAEAFSWANALAIESIAPGLPPQPTGAVIMSVAYWVWFFFAWAALYLALSYSSEVQAEQRRIGQVRLLAHRAQLRALRYQVNPHLIFNALNSVSSLIWDGRREAAEAMVSRLSAFLRSGLAMDPLEDVTIEAELTLQRLYLEIEQVRFPDLKFAISLPDDARNVRVPSLILQPVVENAVKYAVAGANGPARIEVAVAIEGGKLQVTVSDDGGAAPVPGGFGVGLRNIAARLDQQYGDAAGLRTEYLRPRGFRATIWIPLEARS
jgi:two-component system, LytTR family, sensor kinase